MAKKEQKKPSKKSQPKGAAKSKKVSAKAKKAAAPAKKPAAPKSAKAAKSFSVAEFADLTYLTENGVMQWLQQGLLKGQQNAGGAWQVDASNLEVPNVKRLVR
jgi:myosin heavy subunit